MQIESHSGASKKRMSDHSLKFWLTVQSLCPETERARQWLVGNGRRLTVDLEETLPNSASP